MSGQDQQEGSGCAVLVAVILIFGAVVAAVMSIAALVDPFSWLPPVSEIWEDCQDDFDTPEDECELATRFPGFWVHVIVNFAYVVAAVGLLAWLAFAVASLRTARVERFADEEAVARYGEARQSLALVSALTAGLAALPIFVALA